jgi:hypothetical protein
MRQTALGRAGIDAAIAAAIACVLGAPLIGLRLVDQAGGETLATRWPELAAAIGLVFLGRFALSLIAATGLPAALGFAGLFAILAGVIPWPTQFLDIVVIGPDGCAADPPTSPGKRYRSSEIGEARRALFPLGADRLRGAAAGAALRE